MLHIVMRTVAVEEAAWKGRQYSMYPCNISSATPRKYGSRYKRSGCSGSGSSAIVADEAIAPGAAVLRSCRDSFAMEIHVDVVVYVGG